MRPGPFFNYGYAPGELEYLNSERDEMSNDFPRADAEPATSKADHDGDTAGRTAGSIPATGATRRFIVGPHGLCVTCSQYVAGEMMPWHDASPRCESGKRDHCTCDICF